jgi:hypothetical protein
VDATYRAWLDDLALEDVRWVDGRTLHATVPAALPPGPHALVVENAAGRRGGLADAFRADGPPALSQVAVPSATRVTIGQSLSLTVTVTNAGGTARAVLPSLDVSPAGTVTVDAVPAAADVPAGTSVPFVFGCTAAARGAVDLTVSTSGTDAGGAPVTVADAAAALAVQDPPALSATLAVPATAGPGAFTATLLVTNTGEAVATAVVPGALATVAGSSGAADVETAPAGTATLAAGEQASFEWTLLPFAPGAIALETTVVGTDENSGLPVAASARSGACALSVPEVTHLAADPFGDGTPLAQLSAYQGQLLIGPRRDGAAALLVDPDGVTRQLLTFALPEDAVAAGTTTRNAWPGGPPYPSLGAAGCAADTAACGPDGEDARGLFATATIEDTTWLFAGGARSDGGLSYLYLTSSAGPALSFRYVDLSRALAPSARAITAVRTMNELPYLGVSGAGHGALLALRSMHPPASGLDAVPGTDVVDLDLDRMPGLGGAGTPANTAPYVRVDALTLFASRLYVANNGGLVRSTTDSPGGYQGSPADWASCTPSAAEYAARTSLATAKATDLTPADRAVPQLAAWQGRLYAARNTTTGPQVWVCDPGNSGSTSHCDPGDWSLVAADTSPQTTLSRMNDPDNVALSLLVATPTYLYVGFDNPVKGLQLFRATTASPRNAADFAGDGGCVAGSAGCQGVGGGGLGDPGARTRILGGAALTFQGSTQLYLLAGDGVGPLSVHRVAE